MRYIESQRSEGGGGVARKPNLEIDNVRKREKRRDRKRERERQES